MKIKWNDGVSIRENEKLKKESWMNGIDWFPATDALDKIEYEDIEKIMPEVTNTDIIGFGIKINYDIGLVNDFELGFEAISEVIIV